MFLRSQGCCCGEFMTTNVQGGQRAVTRVRVEQIDSQPLSTFEQTCIYYH